MSLKNIQKGLGCVSLFLPGSQGAERTSGHIHHDELIDNLSLYESYLISPMKVDAWKQLIKRLGEG